VRTLKPNQARGPVHAARVDACVRSACASTSPSRGLSLK
jgi:hypothetical protein